MLAMAAPATAMDGGSAENAGAVFPPIRYFREDFFFSVFTV